MELKLKEKPKNVPDGCTTFRRYVKCMYCFDYTESGKNVCSVCGRLFFREATDSEFDEICKGFTDRLERKKEEKQK